jgi:hypothetical protein
MKPYRGPPMTLGNAAARRHAPSVKQPPRRKAAMLKRFFYVFAMNHALWKLGIEPASVSKEIRQRAHQRGYENGYSAREMAAAIAYGAAGRAGVPRAQASVMIGLWLRDGLVRASVIKTFEQAGKLVAQRLQEAHGL